MAFLASLQQDVVIDACEKIQDKALLIAARLRLNELFCNRITFCNAINIELPLIGNREREKIKG